MAIITASNAKRIVINSDLNNLKLTGEIYKKPMYFFSRYEKTQLLAIKEFLKDPENYFREVYQPVNRKDTFTYIYEGKKPAYHKSTQCPMVNSNYENFYIPEEIKEKGEVTIADFRKWFQTVKHLLIEDIKAFEMRLQSRWGIHTNLKGIEKDNSGNEDISNYDLAKIEERIDTIIKEAGRFYHATSKNNAILKVFSQWSYLGNSKDPLKKNETGYSDAEVKEFLRDYHKQFKRPLMTLLIEYYRLTLNPDIKLEGTLLDALGFKKCNHCYSEQ
jgi:hypothetical protein